MPRVRFTQRLQDEYSTLFATCEIRPGRFDDVDDIVDAVLENKARYEAVAQTLGVPWFFIAAIHNLESSRRFTRHLHNGDSLSARTRHVPSGRPVAGNPPFTWEQSATDALRLKKLDQVDEWTLPRLLYELENYNGWGYRLFHSEVLSPYLWGFCTHYTTGKYVFDGTWSHTARSRQCGAGVLIRRLEQRSEIEILEAPVSQKPIFVFRPRAARVEAEELQRFMNGFSGVSLRVDGVAGPKTSDAVKFLFGHFLAGDPRAD